jgi:hypothetical protein
MQSHRNVLVPFVLFLSLLSLSFGASAQTVTRGPYLQTGTPTSVYVKWRTSAVTNSTVRYGLTAGNLSQTASNASSTTEHEIRLTGLSADTQYFYSVGTSTQTLAGGSSYFFVTAPPTGTVKPTRIWVLGDSGTANASAAAVRDGYHTFNAGSPYADLWLMLGDNAYDDGTDAEFQAAVFDMYPQTLRQSVLWPTLGNHDGHTATASSQTGPYFDIFKLPTAGEAGGAPSATEAYYSFTAPGRARRCAVPGNEARRMLRRRSRLGETVDTLGRRERRRPDVLPDTAPPCAVPAGDRARGGDR